jgi:hypothetical protein
MECRRWLNFRLFSDRLCWVKGEWKANEKSLDTFGGRGFLFAQVSFFRHCSGSPAASATLYPPPAVECPVRDLFALAQKVVP